MEQKRLLIEFIKKHEKLASGKFSNDFTYKQSQLLWQEISNLLNSCGGAEKDWKAWRRTWQDIRSRTKSKRSKYMSERGATGGGPHDKYPMTDYETEVLDLIKSVSVEGHANSQESDTYFNFDAAFVEKENNDPLSSITLPDDLETQQFGLHETKKMCIQNTQQQQTNVVLKSPQTVDDEIKASTSKAPATCNILSDIIIRPTGKPVIPKTVLACPKRVPKTGRNKFTNALEASENYRISLQHKNKIKTDYYKQKLQILERIAVAKEKSVLAKEKIADHLGEVSFILEGMKDAIL
ncbi:hypothetical protein RI129_001465 [Pyrocoelia pectoralis]|uniref:Regulatory protein zeste n=1 Tax=Pyrocoelia pectoralis TaxID=417401 RepID=A0AAN7ZXC1_9COLE